MACIRATQSDGSTDDLHKVHQAKSHKSITQIYTDWANHYLDKSKSRRHIHDLQADVSDGVVLAEVIEAVTGQKVPDINKKPKNSTQMVSIRHFSIAVCIVTHEIVFARLQTNHRTGGDRTKP
nr:protein sickie-like [Cherax quadricarinatus]